MTVSFEELDYQDTPLGAISLRRRSEPRLEGRVLYEVKLGEEFLMSSLFTVAETRLAELGLAALEGEGLDIVVGGLGLGYTASAVLHSPRARSLLVIEVMEPVIRWHRQGLVPLGPELTADPRCRFLQGDFFALAGSSHGFDRTRSDSRVHAVLLDIDHSPGHWLQPGNAGFYTEAGLRSLADKLHPGGVFGMWSNEPPDPGFAAVLAGVFRSAQSHVVDFPNPYTGGDSASTVYLAHKA
ncbi:MAG: spermidine synthase [Gammaproteobacteria bacterium]|nr:spermidine synthase [Gammaproteobacteria bacterium]